MKIMVISVRQKKAFYSQPFLKMRKFLLDMSKAFLITSNFYIAEILSEPKSLTIVTSKKLFKMSNYVLILSIFFSYNENQEFAVKAIIYMINSFIQGHSLYPLKVRLTPFRPGPNLKCFCPAPLLGQSTPLFMSYFSCRIRPSPVPSQSS